MGRCGRMGLDDDFQIGQVLPVGGQFATGLTGLCFPH